MKIISDDSVVDQVQVLSDEELVALAELDAAVELSVSRAIAAVEFAQSALASARLAQDKKNKLAKRFWR